MDPETEPWEDELMRQALEEADEKINWHSGANPLLADDREVASLSVGAAGSLQCQSCALYAVC